MTQCCILANNSFCPRVRTKAIINPYSHGTRRGEQHHHLMENLINDLKIRVEAGGYHMNHLQKYPSGFQALRLIERPPRPSQPLLELNEEKNGPYKVFKKTGQGGNNPKKEGFPAPCCRTPIWCVRRQACPAPHPAGTPHVAGAPSAATPRRLRRPRANAARRRSGPAGERRRRLSHLWGGGEVSSHTGQTTDWVKKRHRSRIFSLRILA